MTGLLEEYGIDPDEIPDGPNYDMPDGVYVFEIGRGFIWESDEDGRRAVVLEYLLDDEEGTTGTKSEWFNLPEDPSAPTEGELTKLSFLKSRLASLGFAKEEFAGWVPEDAEGIVGTLQLATSAGKGKNKGNTYQNVRNVKVADDEPTPEVPVKKVAARPGKTTTPAVKKNPFVK